MQTPKRPIYLYRGQDWVADIQKPAVSNTQEAVTAWAASECSFLERSVTLRSTRRRLALPAPGPLY
jgi:hypothetical protein